MSYEGFEQWLCEMGHHFRFDCYEAPDQASWRCSECGSRLAWWNAVDETNMGHEGWESTYVHPEVVDQGKMHTCSACGSRDVVTPARHRIPRDVGHRVDPYAGTDEPLSLVLRRPEGLADWWKLFRIRRGWIGCRHPKLERIRWRSLTDGCPMVESFCPDCGYHDLGHVHG